jgi:hypothetical protein
MTFPAPHIAPDLTREVPGSGHRWASRRSGGIDMLVDGRAPVASSQLQDSSRTRTLQGGSNV